MKIFKDFDLTLFNSYRIKARCKQAFFPECEEDIIDFFKLQAPFVLLGSGHNVILSKQYYEENFLIFSKNYDKVIIDVEKGIIEAEAGVMMKDLSEISLKNSLSGIEIFYDIPSSLGGAVVMNAGASGEEIKDVLVKVRYLDLKDFQIKEIASVDIGFEYRNSFFQKNTDKVVLKAWIKLNPSEQNLISGKMELIRQQRWAKQPVEYPNAGSVFKRPKGYYVGAIIDQLNLKGYTLGGAKISEKHGGFIINFNNATGSDIIGIIELVRSRVLETFKVDLEVEQRII